MYTAEPGMERTKLVKKICFFFVYSHSFGFNKLGLQWNFKTPCAPGAWNSGRRTNVVTGASGSMSSLLRCALFNGKYGIE